MKKKPNDQKVECMKLIDTHEMGWGGGHTRHKTYYHGSGFP